jgi:type 1 glutamine amidotransferase
MNRALLIVLAALLLTAVCLRPAHVSAADATRPIKALMVCGGCCHDYTGQSKVVSEGVSARANVEWTIVNFGKDRKDRNPVYQKADWAAGYDVVLHNECYGAEEDNAYIERITKPHFDGLPAVTLHCSTHSYRAATTDEWRKLLGVGSWWHEKRRHLDITNVAPTHPIMKTFPSTWKMPVDEEMYVIATYWPTVTPLTTGHGTETATDHMCAWTNTYGKARVFGTTIGHDTAAMADPVFLDMVTRGLLWATGHLNEDGTPAAGYTAK